MIRKRRRSFNYFAQYFDNNGNDLTFCSIEKVELKFDAR